MNLDGTEIKNGPQLVTVNQCVTVKGVILSVQYEPDGYTDFSLALDPPYKNMVNQANFNPLMRGGISSEIICQHPESSSVEAFKKGECNEYNGPIFRASQTGEHHRETNL